MEWESKRVLTHWGRTSGRSKSPRKIMRNAYKDWKTTFTVVYDSGVLSREQVLSIITRAGSHIGVGAFRPQCSGRARQGMARQGSFGAFNL